MDRKRTLAALALSIATAFGAGIGGAGAPAVAGPSAPVLREMRWIDPALPRADIVRLMTTQPAECLVIPAQPAEAAKIAVGRAAFGSPLLLGGQAARAGVSCASCHRAGRGNPHFAFPGVSGGPGTADVTSSLFSSKRGDGTDNPRPIPDLVSDPAKIDRDPASPDLRRFIRGLVVEEFDGLEVNAAVLDGLAAYVRALGGACGGAIAQTVTHDAGAATAAVGAAKLSLAVRDVPAAHLLIGAARSALGRIDERYVAVPGIARRLGASDARLRNAQALALTDPAGAVGALDRWAADFGRDVPVLRSTESRSLYAPAVLTKALSGTRP